MNEDQIVISEYAEELINVPRAHVRMQLAQNKSGVSLIHESNILIHCPINKVGMMVAGLIAHSLGGTPPPLGETKDVRASTGVLFRVISIAGLDYNSEEAFVILDRLLEEAILQRGRMSGSE